MNKGIEYLLKYISNDAYKKILMGNNRYYISNLEDRYIDVDLNIRYLIKLGIKDVDMVVLNRLDDLIREHHEFIHLMDDYLKKIGIDGLISMLESC